MNSLRFLAKCHQVTRSISTTSQVRIRELAKLKEIQKQFQVDDGVPIHLKKGASDRVLFACLLLFEGSVLIYSGITLKQIIFPKPNA